MTPFDPDAPRAPAQGASEAPGGPGAYPSDPKAVTELLRRLRDAAAPPANVGHLYCCDPARTLCGEALDPTAVGGPLRPGDEVDCRVCVLADEMDTPCGARLCRIRLWWRRHR